MSALPNFTAYFNFKFLMKLFENSLLSGNVENLQVIIAHLGRVNVAVATAEELETLQLIILMSLLEWVLSMKDAIVDRLQVDCMNIFEICLQVIAKMSKKSTEMNGLQGIREQLVLIRRAWRWRKNSVSVWRCYVKRLRSCLLTLETDFCLSLETGKKKTELKEKEPNSMVSISKNVPATQLRYFMSNTVMADFEEVMKVIRDAYTTRCEDLNDQVAALQGMIPKCDILPYDSSLTLPTTPIKRKEPHTTDEIGSSHKETRLSSVHSKNCGKEGPEKATSGFYPAEGSQKPQTSGMNRVGVDEGSMVSSSVRKEIPCEASTEDDKRPSEGSTHSQTSGKKEKRRSSKSSEKSQITGMNMRSGRFITESRKSRKGGPKSANGSATSHNSEIRTEKEFATDVPLLTGRERSIDGIVESPVGEEVIKSKKQSKKTKGEDYQVVTSSSVKSKQTDDKQCQDPEISSENQGGIEVQRTMRLSLTRIDSVAIKEQQQGSKMPRMENEDDNHVSDTSAERQIVEESSCVSPSKPCSSAKEREEFGKIARLPCDSPTQSERHRTVQKYVNDQPTSVDQSFARRQLYNAEEYGQLSGTVRSIGKVELHRSKLPGRTSLSKNIKRKQRLTFSSESDSTLEESKRRRANEKSSDSDITLPSRVLSVAGSKKKREWNSEETKRLVLGIYKNGTRWAVIKKLFFSNSQRTNVNLKDRYRTLMSQGIFGRLLADVREEHRKG